MGAEREMQVWPVGEASDEDSSADEEEFENIALNLPLGLLLALIVYLWNMFLIFMLSDMKIGVGLWFNSFTAEQATDYAGIVFLLLGFCLTCILYILDWVNWHALLKALSGLLVFSLYFLGVVFNARQLPGASMLIVAFTVPALIQLAQQTCFRAHKQAPSFHILSGCITLSFAIVVLLTWLVWVFGFNHKFWRTGFIAEEIAGNENALMIYKYVYPPYGLNYTADCDLNITRSAESLNMTEPEFQSVEKACKIAASLIFAAWVYPLVSFFANLLVAVFSFLVAWYMGFEGTGKTNKKAQHLLVWALTLLVALLSTCWAASNIKGSSISLGRLLMFSGLVGIVTVVGYLYVQLEDTWDDGNDEVADAKLQMEATLEKTGLKERLQDFVRTDMVRAMFVGGSNILIPTYLLMAWLRDKIDFTRSRETEEEDGEDSSYSSRICNFLANWHWSGILYWICLWGDIYFVLSVGFSKVTYIFLSELNAYLKAHLPFGAVLIAAFLIAVLLFVLLPPLPGVAVYLFCGLLVSGQVDSVEYLNFTGGCVIGILLALFSKLVGSACQYMIGYFLGQNLMIQQQIGVDKVFVRAMEKILRRPGFNPGKVAILVGGPDWPTSVLCGVLKVNLCQMLLGTLPVLFVLAPTAIAGSFQTQQDKQSKSVASACMIITAVVQPLSTMFATQAILHVVSTQEEELAKPRPEHAAVEKLSKEQAKRDKKYQEVTDWNELGFFKRLIIIMAAVLTFASCCAFAFLGSSDDIGQSFHCFRPFTVSSNVSAPFVTIGPNGDKQYGLEGNAFNVVRTPVGWLALAGYFISLFLHVAWKCITNQDAKRALDEGYDTDDFEATSDCTDGLVQDQDPDYATGS